MIRRLFIALLALAATPACASGKPLSITLLPPNQIVTEGQSAQFYLRKSGGNGRTTPVYVTTSEGMSTTATPSTTYPGTIVFVPTKDDLLVNGTHKVTVQGRTTTGATATALVSVLDNDTGGTPPPVPTNVGVNTSTIQYWGGSRPFMNLIYGSAWSMNGPTTADIPAANLDANGWPKSMPAGYHPGRQLSIPTASADIACTYLGNGPVHVVGAGVSAVTEGVGTTTFHYASSYPAVTWASIYWDVDPANYVRNVDCREVGASPSASLAPDYVAAVAGFSVVRFLGWVEAVNENAASITWANRNKPGDGDYVGNDGVPVELMVDLANQTGADPWFTIPWNADDDYVTHFATYVRDHLNAGRKAYVENSNEVWNFGFPQATQAMNEGVAEGLPGDIGGNFQRTAERSGEKTKHVMDIWSTVFAGQTNRLVRIFAWQNASPGYGDIALSYALPSVDAYSTAPYFAFMQTDYTGQSLDMIMNTVLPAAISDTLTGAAASKAVAVSHGLRYIAYEGGQHIVLPSNLTLLGQIEREPRMYTLYTNYLNGWKLQGGGDQIVLTNLQGGINWAGAWGMQEYIGQPISISTTPKMQAVRDYLGIH